MQTKQLNTQADKDKLQYELLELLEAKEQALRYNKFSTYFPDNGPFRRELYPKHIDFMNAGANYLERAFIAANRTGKTKTGAYEMACHLTGEYPSWWKGRVFLNPVQAWAVGVTNQEVKTVLQAELCGESPDYGSGMIPKDRIIGNPRMKSGMTDAVDTICVKHKSGGVSKCSFLSYEQGRTAFQGTKKQVIWLDEEPKDRHIYSECLTRLMDKFNPGIIICTFTPLFGLSDIVMTFLPDGMYPKLQHGSKYVTQVSWEEVPHLDTEQKKQILNSYSQHERDARSKGIPSLGAGAIYPFCEDDITCLPFAVPAYWPRAYGLDVGWNCTACVWGAMNPDTRELFIYSEHYQGQAHPAVHASAIKARGDWIIGAVDPGAGGALQADGKAMIDLYQNEGLILEPADNSVETGILKVSQMFASGQLKIMTTCTNLLKEFRIYRRDEHGKVMKKNDHALDALRYLCMTGIDYLEVMPDPDFKPSSTSNKGKNAWTGY